MSLRSFLRGLLVLLSVLVVGWAAPPATAQPSLPTQDRQPPVVCDPDLVFIATAARNGDYLEVTIAAVNMDYYLGPDNYGLAWISFTDADGYYEAPPANVAPFGSNLYGVGTHTPAGQAQDIRWALTDDDNTRTICERILTVELEERSDQSLRDDSERGLLHHQVLVP